MSDPGKIWIMKDTNNTRAAMMREHAAAYYAQARNELRNARSAKAYGYEETVAHCMRNFRMLRNKARIHVQEATRPHSSW